MRDVRIATCVNVGFVFGFLGGLIEGLQALADNGPFGIANYWPIYLGLPLLLWTLVGVACGLAVGLVDRIVCPRSSRCDASVAFYQYGIVAVAVGSALATWAWLHDLRVEVQQVGGHVSEVLTAAFTALFFLLAASIGGVAVVGLSRTYGWEPPWKRRLLLIGVPNLLIACVLANLIPTILSEGRAVITGTGRGATRTPGEANLVIVSIDTLRADRLGIYAAAYETPGADRLGREGVVFDRAISASPWTLPSMASIMTGRLPARHDAGRTTNGWDLLAKQPLAEGETTIAEVLAIHGYLTQAFVTNPYLGLRYGLGQGFAGYENVTLESELLEAFPRSIARKVVLAFFPELSVTDRAESIVDRAEAWLRRHRDQKFFLWLHFIDPHAPYREQGSSQSKSFRGDTGMAKETSPQGGIDTLRIARLRAGEVRLDEAEKEALVRLYEGEVRTADAQVARLLDVVDELGIGEDTLIVLVSDHGEEFWEHGTVEHGHQLYEEVLRVPLLMRGPGVPRGVRAPGVVRTIDIVPTVSELLLGPASLEGIDGRSLVERFHSRGAPRAAISENMLFSQELRSVTTDELKLIVAGDGREELFDTVADPEERINLVGCRDSLPARAALSGSEAMNERGAASAADVISPDLRRGLRALGYAE